MIEAGSASEGFTLLMRLEIASVVTYATYVMGMQLLTDVRKN